MSTSIISLSVQQLRRAADIKEKLQSLEKEIGQILGVSTTPAAYSEPKKRRKMSAAGRARMAAAARKRWAKVKGGKLTVKPVKKAKRRISAEGRKKMAAAAKARWAKAKAAGKNKL